MQSFIDDFFAISGINDSKAKGNSDIKSHFDAKCHSDINRHSEALAEESKKDISLNAQYDRGDISHSLNMTEDSKGVSQITNNDISTNQDKTEGIESNTNIKENLNTAMLDSLNLGLKCVLLSANVSNLSLYSKSQTFMSLLESSFNDNIHSKHSSITGHSDINRHSERSEESKNMESRNTSLSLNTTQDSNNTIEQIAQKLGIIQRYILDSTNPLDLKLLKPYLLRLNSTEILDNKSAKSLINLFANIHTHKQKEKTNKKINLKALSNELDEIHKKILTLDLDSKATQDLERIYTNAKSNKFSIGITGVLSAGKSTFLNALMGSEILGSSTIPETANLTVLKHSEDSYANVHFWSKEEWQDMRESAKYDNALQSFVNNTEAIFENLGEFLDKTLKISLQELPRYTSANHESKLCNLVKKVELFSNLAFLQNGVEIVDTPGLDDPITKREEITKAYLQECDLLVHVMNASCAATQIDIDFILESLLQKNISRLLVVLTRIDLIGKRELEQSLEYTKNSIALQLKKVQYSGDIDSIIERIDFIPTASFFALLHRSGREQEALQSGFDMEKTGIPEVERYLHTILLGEDSLKQKDILYLAYRGFLHVVSKVIENLSLELKILNSSSEELAQILDEIKKQESALLQDLAKRSAELESRHESINEFLTSLSGFIDKGLKLESAKLKQRVYDEILYHYEKGAKPNEERLVEIVESGFSDCFSDISREYKYKLGNKISQALEDINSNVEKPNLSFRAPKDKISAAIQGLQDKILSLSQKHGKHSKEALDSNLQSAFMESFDIFGAIIKEKNSEVGNAFLQYLSEVSSEQKELIREQIAQKQEVFNNTLKQKDRADSKEYRESISTKISALSNIRDDIGYIERELR